MRGRFGLVPRVSCEPHVYQFALRGGCPVKPSSTGDIPLEKVGKFKKTISMKCRTKMDRTPHEQFFDAGQLFLRTEFVKILVRFFLMTGDLTI